MALPHRTAQAPAERNLIMRRRRNKQDHNTVTHSATGSPSSAELLRRIRDEQEQKAAELEQRNPILGVQAMAENELAYTKLMSNLAQLEHQTRMAIINNIK
jgi:hypothetical protein